MMAESIINVGAEDKGILYNSYLICAEKNVLIDTVPNHLSGSLIENIKKRVDIEKLDAVVINHTEQDRCGALSELLKLNEKIQVIASLSGLKNIEQQLNHEFCGVLAKSNMIYPIGDGLTLKFIITHNINWPDSMMTYFAERKTLFSCDAFSSEKDGMKEYYNDKLAYMAEYVINAMNTIKSLNIDVIYPGSGEKITDISVIDSYLKWSKPESGTDIAIVYESKSGNTEIMAKRAERLLKSNNISAELISADNYSDYEVLEKMYRAEGVLIGTPTHNRNISKKIGVILVESDSCRIGKKKFASFGSYGWSGEAPNLVYSLLRARHIETFKSPFRFMFTPNESDFETFDEYVLSFCEFVLEK